MTQIEHASVAAAVDELLLTREIPQVGALAPPDDKVDPGVLEEGRLARRDMSRKELDDISFGRDAHLIAEGITHRLLHIPCFSPR